MDGTKRTETRGDVAVKYVLCAVSTHKVLLHHIPTSGSILHHVLLPVWPH